MDVLDDTDDIDVLEDVDDMDVFVGLTTPRVHGER
jgi:hypothetical protein